MAARDRAEREAARRADPIRGCFVGHKSLWTAEAELALSALEAEVERLQKALWPIIEWMGTLGFGVDERFVAQVQKLYDDACAALARYRAEEKP